MTTNTLAPLSSYSKDVHSQGGEDGIIAEILRRLNPNDQGGWCVEFGAWDGIYLSNTYNLIKNKNYKAVLIEGDPEKHKELCKNIPSPEVHKICRFVGFEGESSLDGILKTTPIPADFDFLSIDIDGCDYYILESLKQYRPKLICIEFNPTIPNEVEFVQRKSFSVKHGSSPRSLLNLANKMGYALVAVTHANLFLVRNDLKERVIGAQNLTLDDLRKDSDIKMFIFSGYDGTLLSNRSHFHVHWHDVQVPVQALQPLPRFLRIFPSDYSGLRRVLFSAFKKLKKRPYRVLARQK